MLPKIIHMIYLGDAVTPWAMAARTLWAELNPDWSVWWHTDDRDLDECYRPYYDRVRWTNLKTDLLRMSILRRHGGVYVDCDTAPLVPLDEWLLPVAEHGIVCAAMPGGFDSWFLAACPGADVFGEIEREILKFDPEGRRLRPRIYAARLLNPMADRYPAWFPHYPVSHFTTGVKAADRRALHRMWRMAGEPVDVGSCKALHYYAGNRSILEPEDGTDGE